MPQHSWLQVEGQVPLFDKHRRYRKSRVWLPSNQIGTRAEQLSSARQLNSIQSKNPSHALMDERLNR